MIRCNAAIGPNVYVRNVLLCLHKCKPYVRVSQVMNFKSYKYLFRERLENDCFSIERFESLGRHLPN